MIDIVVHGINDCIPDMTPFFNVIDTNDYHRAQAIIIWNDIMDDMTALCETARMYRIPTFVMQHGRGATYDYAHMKRLPRADYMFCWTQWDKDNAVKDGWDEDKVFIVGNPLFSLPIVKQPRKNKVVLVPMHDDVGNVTQRNTALSKRAWHELAQMADVRPVVKLIEEEHNASDYPGTKCITGRWYKGGHTKGIYDLLSDTSIAVVLDDGTFAMFAMAFDIPIIKLRNQYDNNTEAVFETRVENLQSAVRYALQHPENRRAERAKVLAREGGNPEEGPLVASRMAAIITERVKKGVIRLAKTDGKTLTVTCFQREPKPCNYYRMTLPLGTVGDKTDIKVNFITQGMPQNKASELLDVDVYYTNGFDNQMIIPHVKKAMEHGKKLVVDWDDNPFAVSPLSPHYKEWGIENVDYRWDDNDIIPLWVDGKNIDIESNRRRLECLRESMDMAHLVTATTPILTELFSERNRNVKVLPNCIDLAKWQRVPVLRDDPREIRLYWSGGSSHYEDWTLLEEPLIEIMNMYPETKLYILGVLFKGAVRKLPAHRVVFKPWVDFEAYPYVTAIINADISIIPLRDTPFNRCKSNIKWIEQAALEVPSVTSKVSPYKEHATEDNGVWVTDNSSEGWYKGIATLIEDHELRVQMGKKAREYVVENFDIATQYWRWVDMIKEVA